MTVKMIAIDRLFAGFDSFFAFFIQSSATSGDGVPTDNQGRIVLGGNKFAIISKRLIKDKVLVRTFMFSA